MIVTSGWCKGMTISTPPGAGTRPSSAKFRESLMNILSSRLPGAVFIDLFAGSGAIGLEALSRGADACVFVEVDRKAQKLISTNLAELCRRAEKQNIPRPKAQLIAGDVDKKWNSLEKWGKADILWADPPYSMTEAWLKLSIDQIDDRIETGGVFVLEAAFDGSNPFVLNEEKWDLIKNRRYGNSVLYLWEKR